MSFSEGRETRQERKEQPEIERITSDTIKQILPPAGNTDITLQRHGDYIRESESERVGSLTEASRQEVRAMVRSKITSMLRDISSTDQVFFLVTGSPTKHHEKGQRSLETAQIVREEIEGALDAGGFSKDALLNNRSRKEGAGVPPIRKVEAPRFIDTDTPYFEFLLKKHDGNITPDFWGDFESDAYAEDRKRLNGEGPDEIDQRFTTYLNGLKKFSEAFHKTHQNARLVIWNVTHYDTISPFVKRHVDHSDKDRYLPVDLGGGVTLELREGNLETQIGETRYTVN